jgi:hypothetical protein
LGLVLAAIDIPERWRSWQDSGLTHLLGPLPWVDDFRQTSHAGVSDKLHGAEAQACSQSSEMKPSLAQKSGAALPDMKAEKFDSASARSYYKNKPPSSSCNFAKEATSDSERATSISPARSDIVQRPLPTSNWPEVWKDAWSKTGFARPFLWTYEQLGEDLLGTPSPERREVLKKLLAFLDLGSVHNFWPFTEPDEQGGMRLQAGIFQEGLAYLAPKCVIFFGNKEIAEVTTPGKPELFKFISYLNTGSLCVHIPEIQELVENQAMLETIKDLFQKRLTHLI